MPKFGQAIRVEFLRPISPGALHYGELAEGAYTRTKERVEINAVSLWGPSN